MNFTFEVGQDEKHRIRCDYDNVLGKTEITVDGVYVIQNIDLAQVRLTKRHELQVGVHEQHAVVIESKRPLLFPLFRPKRYRVFVDGELAETFRGR